MTFIASRTPWLDQLTYLPSNWALVCVNEKKQPYDPLTGLLTPGWNHSDGYSVEDVQALEPAAVGVMLGAKSGGLLAIDFDGPGADEKFLEVTGKAASDLPKQFHGQADALCAARLPTQLILNIGHHFAPDSLKMRVQLFWNSDGMGVRA